MRTLIVVDIQNDFLPGGALPVAQGDQVIPVANRLMPAFDLVVATKDWHPANHGSFASTHPGTQPGDIVELGGVPQILWPDHCVQDTWGAEFGPGLQTDAIDHLVYKGTDPEIDSYSTFYDNAWQRATGLHDYLRERGVREIHLLGLATDYCVLYSVRDARKLGYTVFVVQDGCRGIDLHPGDVDRAFAEMREIGATLVWSNELAEAA
ncbi:MAG TPA: bifunctional nicotinamidase/pyrazinamidase [Armatimonadota bacterium]|jgi:nicotinamidase/pyrazinamidase